MRRTPWVRCYPRPQHLRPLALLGPFVGSIPAAAQMVARAGAPVGAGLLVAWLGGYTPMLIVLAVIAFASTVAMGVFALSARPLRLHCD